MISQLANRWLNRLYKAIAILLVLFAVLISTLRIALPYANPYFPYLQDFLNEQYHSNVIIGSMSLDWNDHGPSLVAENVSLVRIESTDIYIQSIDVQVDFWASLRNLNIVTEHVNLIGVKVYLDQTVIEQSGSEQTESEHSLIKRLSTIFLEQIEQFTLFGSQIVYHTDTGNRTFLISELKWLNSGDNRHRASGDVIVDGLTSNNLSLQLDLYGNEFDDMQGQVYLDAQELNITPWLDEVFAIENEKTDSSINFTAWLAIKNGRFDTLSLDVGNNEVSFLYNDQLQSASLSYGSIVIKGLADKQTRIIKTTPLSVITNNQEWAPLTVEAFWNETQSFAHISSINLSGLAILYPLFSLDEQTRDLIFAMQPQGEVSDIFVENKQATNDLKVVANFNNITTQYSQGIPGIENLSGELVYTPQKFYSQFYAENGAIDFDKHFVLPLPYQTLSAAISAQQDKFGWKITAPEIALKSSEINLSAELALRMPEQGDPEMSLLTSITEGKTENAFHYYPHLLMGDNLVNYLKRALVSGDLEKIQVLYNGSFKQFPFTDNSGTFNVDVELSNSEFLFSSEWPAITDFNANLNFNRDSMMITARSGDLTGLDVSGVKVGIDTLSNNQVLTVEASFENTLPSAVEDLMNASSLAGSVGATLKALNVTKPIAGDFALTLPLDDTSQAVATGSVLFSDNNINLKTPQMYFTKVNGKLNYQNDKITTEGLSLNWLGLPVELEVNADDREFHYATNIALTAQWQEHAWKPFVFEPLQSYISGNLNWQGNLLLAMHHDGDFSYDFELSSNLKALQASLPSPLNKSLNDERLLSLRAEGQSEQSHFTASYGKQLSFNGKLDHQNSQFSQAHLNIGKQKMLLPMPGFHISADLAQASIDQWQPFITDIIATINLPKPADEEQQVPLFPVPGKIRGRVKNLDVYGQQLSNVNFNMFEQTPNWLVQLNADGVRAEVDINNQKQKTHLDINAEYIRLTTQTDESENQSAESPPSSDQQQVKTKFIEDIASSKKALKNMPSIAFRCDDCQVNKLDLGQVSFEVKPKSDTQVLFTDMLAKRGKTRLTATGAWQLNQDESQSQTAFKAEIDADDLEVELIKLGFASYIKDSGFTGQAQINWAGGPHNFTLVNADAKLSTRLDDGYIAKADDKGVRLLSILSLESLVRKMALDFRDMFSDGMFYSEIRGDFELKDGILYTDNTIMRGTAGDLTIKGNTDLASAVLDYRMSYKPNLTSSLPVIAWITTLNPVTFLAGIALNEVITSTVVSEINYEATGPLDNPEFKEVNRKTRDIRVGRSTPPEVIGDETIIEAQP